ncbi:MAG: hypothetical protein N4A43_00755, partial [Alphaproteobacteria bacterium]|nr:hypothetical protein [Alphaproteobacteria bacterium]
GLDGAGKTTCINSCITKMNKKGLKVEKFISHSGGASEYWQTILEYKKRMKNTVNAIPVEIDQTFHSFEFLQYCKNELPERLKEVDFLFADRYILSRNVLCELETDKNDSFPANLVNSMVDENIIPSPDIIFYLKINPLIARKRIELRGGNIEDKESLEMLKKANDIFDKRVSNRPEIKIINADQSGSKISDEILSYLF